MNGIYKGRIEMKNLWNKIFGKSIPEVAYIIDKQLRAEFELWGEEMIKVYIIKMSSRNGIPDDEVVEQFVVGIRDNVVLDWKIEISRQELGRIYNKLQIKG